MLSILRFAPWLKALRFHALSEGLFEADKRLPGGIASMRKGTEACLCSPLELLSEETLAKIDSTL